MITLFSSPRRAVLTSLVLVLIGGMGVGTHGPRALAGGPVALCQAVTYRVALAPGAAAGNTIAGTLCAPPAARTVQVLIGGIGYGRTYWDWPLQPERYSYVRYVTRAGYATLSFDRIGYGQSSHPPATATTIDANAYTIHQLVTALRARGGFKRIILVGHSLGSEISTVEAGRYQDVDGVVLTGWLHAFGRRSALLGKQGFLPAQQSADPAVRVLPPGYLVLRPGARRLFFDNASTMDPTVLAYDEAHLGTATAGEVGAQFVTYLLSPRLSRRIVVPVLDVIGTEDQLFGAPPRLSAQHEHTFYSPRAAFQIVVIPGEGHALNIHLPAPAVYATIRAWADAHGGPRG